MIIPVLNKNTTLQELSNLCWLLNEIKTNGEDSNLRWKVAQLLSNAEAVQEKFLEDFHLFSSNPSTHFNQFLEKLTISEQTDAMLSFAFNSVATIDSARFAEFEPNQEFKDKIKSIKKETLHLLHENKGWKTEED